MWLCWLAILVVIALGCAFLAPDSGLHNSALQAFDSSVRMLSRVDAEPSATTRSRVRTDCEDDGPRIARGAAGALPSRITASTPTLRSVRGAPRPTPPLRTSTIRKRVTPLMQKRVAARYNFKCAICGLPFTDSSLWEVDHIVPLNTARTAADVERLNSELNLQPVHRSCHQLKSSKEASAR